MCSLVLMRVDWKGLANRHGEAVENWSDTLKVFQELRLEDGTLPQDQRIQLSEAYWKTGRMTIAIPDKRFNRCKSRYLLKCEISAMKSDYNGCPRVVLWAIIRCRGTWRAIRDSSPGHQQECQSEDQEKSASDN